MDRFMLSIVLPVLFPPFLMVPLFCTVPFFPMFELRFRKDVLHLLLKGYFPIQALIYPGVALVRSQGFGRIGSRFPVGSTHLLTGFKPFF